MTVLQAWEIYKMFANTRIMMIQTAGHNSRQVAKKMPKSKSVVNYEDFEDSDESSLSTF